MRRGSLPHRWACAFASLGAACAGVAASGQTIRVGDRPGTTADVPRDPAPGQWTHLGRDATRVGLATGTRDAAVEDLGETAWIASTTVTGEDVFFIGPTSPVSAAELVIAVGFTDASDVVCAYDADTGTPVWTTPVPTAVLDSWSSPAIDLGNRRVVVGTGTSLIGLDLGTGDVVWSADIGTKPIVNASPAVTTDLGPADRAFITSYSISSSGGGELICVNVDAFDAALNPFEPGEIVWRVPIGETSGNTPAYADGVVYVASVGAIGGAGRVFAFDASAAAPPPPLWTAFNTNNEGFFGGVSIAEGVGNRAVFAASYAFGSGQFSANLIKLDAMTGSVLWSVGCNRTGSTPIVLDDGWVVVSTGVAPDAVFGDFGSRPAVQVFQDLGASAQLVWDSSAETWEDTNGNGQIDPGEYLSIGGWTHHPVLVAGELGQASLLVGTMPVSAGPVGFFEPNVELRLIDLDVWPGDPGFVRSVMPGTGSSPALVRGMVYSIGDSGLRAIRTGTTPKSIGRERVKR